MATRQYVGARYVTKIYENSLDPSSAEWEGSVNYEPLTLVTYNNGSYLSKKEVPGSVGDPASNPLYWVQTGFYNGQIAALDARIQILESVSYIMIPTGDTTDRSNELNTALTEHSAVLFVEGDYYFNGNITLPDNAKLFGVGASSVLKFVGTGSFITCGDNNEIASLTFDGGEASRPTTQGNDIAITVDGKTNPIKIHDCNIIGFNNIGIYVANMGWTHLSSIEVVNCFFKWNIMGVHFDEYGEYGLVTNSTFYDNYIGANVQGGNNSFANCHIVRNHFGVQMACNGIANSAHGSFSGCSFNHNDYGIQIKDTANGESITGCLFYGSNTHDIEFINCTAIMNLTANQFGASSAWGIVGSTLAVKNNTFAGAPTIGISTSTITGFGNTTGTGAPIDDLNKDCDPFKVTVATPTYTSNSAVTESDFNSGVKVYKKGGFLTLKFNLVISGNPGGSFVQIGTIPLDANLIGEPIFDFHDASNNPFIIYLHADGRLEIHGSSTGSIRMAFTFPL